MHVADTRAAQSELIGQLRKRPDDVDARLQLFRYAVVDGNWDRALNQLDVAERLDAGLSHTALVYRRNIVCEGLRQRVFGGEGTPLFLGTPPPWIGYLVEALRAEDDETSAKLVQAALGAARCASGIIDGAPFAWLADADSRLGPVLEAFIDGKYYWVPFEHCSRIAIPAPEDLLDLAWCPAELTLTNGGTCNGYIPTRYPSCAADATDTADALKLARLTEWHPWSDSLQKGAGQRMFVSDAGDYALLDCREIRFDALPADLPQ
ncbi:type VI secretion system accessory protein TagJ [Noviherbaspirillum sp.]|uniref:type VI secretion system accessory protein TagJ n=1 Tax=Noviherbaspirillum sp. TaxID=1926288 RepID=UPI002D4A16D0|nr:type VI secretion system accessory protein TagJ [Noviherbaspirillum sp.]HZW19946.1 type VI secretion system accessory protein TagJ [Noviherbaspirillum sp.]